MPARKIEGSLPESERQPGSYTFGPEAIDPDVRMIVCTIHRVDWEELRETEVGKVMIQVSYNGGRSWENLIGCGVGGGRVFNEFGVENFTSSVRRAIEQVGSSERMVRGSIVLHERLRTKIDIDYRV